ncbi:hypothetical protein [Arcobacter sp.]|uniref:hypothetical protein n=1 Tax=Arcobacter sp. TaxID=1872629 RepID=UPI003C73C66D
MLKHKKILLIAPKFHHYHLSIKEGIEQLGANVIFMYDVVNNKFFNNIRHRTKYPINRVFDNFYHKYMLSQIDDSFDIIFLIRGELIDKVFLEKVRKKALNAKFVMYQWDSLAHHKYKDIIPYFDKVYSFDKKDAKTLNIKYLPLFYTQEYKIVRNSSQDKIYDIVFFGTHHSGRLDIIKKIESLSKKNNLKFKHHLYTNAFYKFKLRLFSSFPKEDLKYLKTKTLTLKDIVKIYEQSKAVLDIEMSNQTGLTIRTIEALGAGKKLLTTNKEIINSEIYDSNYVQIIDRDDIKIDSDFFKDNAIDNTEKLKKYSLENWLIQILKVANNE